jgi:anhydro-N-acetylmuramic acid kinase
MGLADDVFSKQWSIVNGIPVVPNLQLEVLCQGSKAWPKKVRVLLLALADPSFKIPSWSLEINDENAESASKSSNSEKYGQWDEGEVEKIETRAALALRGLHHERPVSPVQSNAANSGIEAKLTGVMSSMAISEANFLVAECFAAALKSAQKEWNILPSQQEVPEIDELLDSAQKQGRKLDLIGSHGQTIWHHQNRLDLIPNPYNASSSLLSRATDRNHSTLNDVQAATRCREPGSNAIIIPSSSKISSTLQICDTSIISARLGGHPTVIGDFRTGDISQGGQGAPLTSSLDCILVSEYAEKRRLERGAENSGWIALQNIGGMGNVSLIPPRSSSSCTPFAYDTGPGNVLLDWHIGKVTGAEYDADGAYGAKGTPNQSLLRHFLLHPYFALPYPKTCGREVFTSSLGEQWWSESQRGEFGQVSSEDFQATLTDLTACSIILSYLRFVYQHLRRSNTSEAASMPTELFISGGGNHNSFLMARIQHYASLASHGNLADLEQHVFGDDAASASLCSRLDGHEAPNVFSHSSAGIDPDAKESVLFALLAYLCIHGIPSNIPSCTGASSHAVLGKISPGSNFLSLLK